VRGRKRAPRLLIARWALPVFATAAAIPLTGLAYDTGKDLRSHDVCATGWDNVWSTASAVSLWIALISGVIFTMLAVRGRRRVEATLGAIAVVLILILSVGFWVQANAAYGWDCNS
jgi:hypothetical protein